MITPRRGQGDSEWFTNARFGLFIHWGLYAMAARHEWMQHHEKKTAEQYDVYFRNFEPDLYDPMLWATTAKKAGMKYFVITTKHHEGFCLWDSALTDFKAPQAPQCRRDLLTPMVSAFRSQGLRTGFYHSLIDWRHPDFIVDVMHPQRGEDLRALNRNRRQERYYDYLHGQVRELLTQFGLIDLLWFDFSYPPKAPGADRMDFTLGKGREAWNSEQLLEIVRELQPHVLVNDRLDLAGFLSGGDFKTPEQVQPRRWIEVDETPVVWEACQTFCDSWGYHRNEPPWRDSTNIIQSLIDSVSKGGNFMLNVGPDARGRFDPRSLNILEEIGQWMDLHERAITGCTQAPSCFPTPADCRLTYNPERHRLYIHLFSYPYKMLHLDGAAFRERVEYAQFLHDGSEVVIGLDEWHGNQVKLDPDELVLTLPLQRPTPTVPVIELILK
ncbi:MAG: alpha-L-fucosidase [Chthoniobacterales bacterium]|nr:alpha-L-fucosidase [Chthoniobacterales bacterium]